ncbi:cytochrome P450 [Exidia glandulosa HHB12029]|uniref:Cytochrome P450 n=1 Tax=Exidia glandulosa HHB12029 TaxID=1314781 RepID=A0A165Q3K3_EXIGL|nr:cytochrome P450 [Exidia glandulosa HHB12029]
MHLSLSQFALLCLTGIVVTSYVLKRSRKAKRLPPGPPRRFIVGNMYNLPQPPEEWKGYAALAKQYGPVTYLRIFTSDVIVLNTMKAATDLMDKRSAVYSDRPRFTMASEVLGMGWITSAMPYGNWWRQHRRALHQHLNESASKRWWTMHEDLNVRFLRRLMDAPEDWFDLAHWLAGANIIRMTFGLDTALKHDPWVQMGIDTVEIFSKAAAFGTFAVDFFPALKYVPSWLPGGGFKRDAAVWREKQYRTKELMFKRASEMLASPTAGAARQSITSELLDAGFGGASIDEEVIKNTVGVMYIAGADTSFASMRAFVHAMLVHPTVQRTVQAELDAKIPTSRLPTLTDRSHLPYLEAVIREVMRTYPVTPMGVSHRVTKDDEYEGMHIPKGATVIANTWAILNDEQLYPEPNEFKPERFLRDLL